MENSIVDLSEQKRVIDLRNILKDIETNFNKEEVGIDIVTKIIKTKIIQAEKRLDYKLQMLNIK